MSATGPLEAGKLLVALRSAGFDLFTGTPCSHLGPLLDAVAGDPAVRWIPAPNEGDAVALAAGAAIGGRRPVALFQNSGLGNAVNALTSLCDPFRVPLLLLVSHRGRPGEAPDEPQHRLMGRITEPLLDAMEIGHRTLGEAPEGELLAEATRWMEARERPFALIVPPGMLARGEPAPSGGPAPSGVAPAGRTGSPWAGAAVSGRPGASATGPLPPPTFQRKRPGELPTRADVLRDVLSAERPGDILVGTTGHTGRQLHDLSDGPARLYVVGSMGSASAVGLGLALARPERRVVVLDGDGALLMRMGNLALVGSWAPPSFLHVVLDNGVHASTGGQPVTGPVRFADAARACGYAGAEETDDPARVAEVVAAAPAGPFLLHVRTAAEDSPSAAPGRPSLAPHEVKERLTRHLDSLNV